MDFQLTRFNARHAQRATQGRRQCISLDPG
jgi:hypothetical protein